MSKKYDPLCRQKKQQNKWFMINEDDRDEDEKPNQHSVLYHVMQRRKESYYKGI